MEEEEKQKILREFQTYQQQLQTLLIQEEALNLQKFEITRALEELEKSSEEFAYKIAGGVMIKKSVEELKKELKEDVENLNLKIKTIKSGKERINNKLLELQKRLKEVEGGGSGKS
jgi:prefoldin beta subunit